MCDPHAWTERDPPRLLCVIVECICGLLKAHLYLIPQCAAHFPPEVRCSEQLAGTRGVEKHLL